MHCYTRRSFAAASVILYLTLSVTQSHNPWELLKMKQFCKPAPFAVTVTQEGCKTEVFTVNACLGLCSSYVQVTWQEPFFINQCQCCTATEVTEQKFTLQHCAIESDRRVLIQSARKCSCTRSDC